jgi:hypothetical protein
MKKTTNVAASVRQRLLNYSTTIKADPNLVLIWYGIERLLYRLSLSPHRDQFVLKGAMLFRVWSGPNFRATKDLDLLGFVREEAEPLRKIFVSICERPRRSIACGCLNQDGSQLESFEVAFCDLKTLLHTTGRSRHRRHPASIRPK